ncbi:MutS-related protein [Ascidiimonas sp. W6]|uniref:MutS-related protein n=1 Tax=Ascidiimonas meishanensis TaxID=3128903 RepID=UPI0030EB2BEE
MNYTQDTGERIEAPINYYKSRLKTLQNKLIIQKRSLRNLSLLRLLVFLATALAMYWLYSGVGSLFYLGIPGCILFLFLVSKYIDLKYYYEKTQKLIEINTIELKVLNRDFKELSNGSEFLKSSHEFSKDIDLFGKGSFFQYLNRTSLAEGKEKLAELLMANDIENIKNRQEALHELSKESNWRQEFAAMASMIKAEISSNLVVQWINSYQAFTPVRSKMFSILFSLGSIALIIASASDLINERFLLYWFFIGLGISGRFFKRVNKLSEHTTKLKSTFDQYHQLMKLLENKEFKSVILNNKLASIQKGAFKTSIVLKDFSKSLNSLDQRNNMLFGVLANGFLLWDLYQSRRIEEWIKSYSSEVEKWFDLIRFFDAHNSLANFVFNHPKYCFPKISEEKIQMRALQASHPLLDSSRSVKNDFELIKGQFLIITGANMAGKSTFLRTVSLLVVMGNAGLPVCAEEFSYHPVKLITSMRTSDSLTDDESYFFSELKRLKFIVETIQNEKYFVILDEILKGTNSTDKANGSKKFIEKLVQAQITGIVATHDLSLCELEENLSQVKNYYFDAEINNDELYFDYRLKKGVCKNMNASFLLKKMNIV